MMKDVGLIVQRIIFPPHEHGVQFLYIMGLVMHVYTRNKYLDDWIYATEGFPKFSDVRTLPPGTRVDTWSNGNTSSVTV